MKNLIYIPLLSGLILLAFSCVDDYQDANPPRAKDGPFFKLSSGGDVLQTPSDGDFIGASQTLTLTLSVIDCQGGIDSVGVVLSDTIATAVVDEASLNAVKGQVNGEIKVNVMTDAEIDAETDLTVDVTLYDGQEPLAWYGKVIPYRKSSVESYDVTVVTCTSTGLAGTYDAVASGFTGDGSGGTDAEYSDLSSVITITEVRPGEYTIDDMSFGVYPELYGDDAPSGNVNLCDKNISDRGDTDQYGDSFTIVGMLNDDGTVSITWNNHYGDRGEVSMTPQ